MKPIAAEAANKDAQFKMWCYGQQPTKMNPEGKMGLLDWLRCGPNPNAPDGMQAWSTEEINELTEVEMRNMFEARRITGQYAGQWYSPRAAAALFNRKRQWIGEIASWIENTVGDRFIETHDLDEDIEVLWMEYWETGSRKQPAEAARAIIAAYEGADEGEVFIPSQQVDRKPTNTPEDATPGYYAQVGTPQHEIITEAPPERVKPDPQQPSEVQTLMAAVAQGVFPASEAAKIIEKMAKGEKPDEAKGEDQDILAQADDWPVGTVVQHREYGEGIVEKRWQTDDANMASIDFVKQGVVELDVDQAELCIDAPAA